MCYLDDIYVEGDDQQQHDERLNQVLDRLKSRGVCLNVDKCEIGVSEVQFLGHVVSENSIRPSPAKVDALISFRCPVNASEVKSFLGLANYMNKYIQNLATLDEPLRKLTQQAVKFQWGETEQKSFDAIKKALLETVKLGYFNVKDATSLIVDASPVALGAILVQTNDVGEHRVISCASKSLTDTETRYCQTEKEALAAVWGAERYQMYLLGKHFDLVTDCKALQFLFTSRSKPCARIERWVLRIQAFDYTVKHVPGEMNIADVLSRLSTLKPVAFDLSEELFINEVVAAAANNIAIRWEEIDTASKQDKELQEILKSLASDRLFELPIAYRVIGQELSQVGNILMRGDRIVIPQRLREKVLYLAHEGHPGTRMMKSHLRVSVWWPKMDADVEGFVKRCRGCTLVSAPEVPEPMSRRELPSGPWEDVAIDFLGPLPEGQFLLVVIDYYSRFFEVCEMSTITAEATVKELTVIFSRFGVPISLTADNAPQLSEDCEEFSTFCTKYGVKLINTIPYWPQMNGEVERQNRTILKRLQIAQELGQDWRGELQKFLLMYRATPHPTTGRSPAELMFGHRIRSKLPQLSAFRREDEETRDRDQISKEKGKQYGDNKRRAKESTIAVGDYVLAKRMRKDNKLCTEFMNEEFVVLTKQDADVTIKSLVSGKQFRRNAAHLKRIEMIPEGNIGANTSRADDGERLESTEDLTVPSVVAGKECSRKRKEPSWFEDYVPHYVKKD